MPSADLNQSSGRTGCGARWGMGAALGNRVKGDISPNKGNVRKKQAWEMGLMSLLLQREARAKDSASREPAVDGTGELAQLPGAQPQGAGSSLCDRP